MLFVSSPVACEQKGEEMKAAVHGAYIGILGLMECKKYVLYAIRKR